MIYKAWWDCGDDDRLPEWVVVREDWSQNGCSIGTIVEHHSTQEAAEESAWVLNRELEQEYYNEFG